MLKKFLIKFCNLHALVIMESSKVAIFLMKQYLNSLALEINSPSSDPILSKFKEFGEKLEDSSTKIINADCITWLSDLNDALTEWKKLKEQKKSIRRTLSFQDHVAKIRSPIEAKLKDLENLCHHLFLNTTRSSPPNLIRLDRYTIYKPGQVTCIQDKVSDEKKVVDWLVISSSEVFKAVGIYGTGGSEKTEFVSNILNQKVVRDKFKCIIWACLSELSCEEEMDEWIVKYLLYRLGLDVDSLVGNLKEDKDWRMKELERRLLKSGNYVLVLDDMWHCSKWFADDLLGMLKKIGGGSVIVTSRKKTLAEKIGDKSMVIHLDLNTLAHKESAIVKDDEVVISDLGNGNLFE